MLPIITHPEYIILLRGSQESRWSGLCITKCGLFRKSLERVQLTQIAWRNLWRNKRRTLLTSFAVAFAIFFATLLESLNEGMWDYFIANDIEMYSAHIEIQQTAYRDNPGLDNAIVDPSEVFACLDSLPGVVRYTARLEMFVLAAVYPMKQVLKTNPADAIRRQK